MGPGTGDRAIHRAATGSRARKQGLGGGEAVDGLWKTGRG